jgi:hypothetical protein
MKNLLHVACHKTLKCDIKITSLKTQDGERRDKDAAIDCDDPEGKNMAL